MNYYSQEPAPENARLTVSSVVLLTIFVGAALFIIYAALTTPWADDDKTTLTPNPALQEVPADGAGEDDGQIALQPSE